MTATPANDFIVNAAKRNQPLPPGDLWFTPPLELTDVMGLVGSGERTVLRASAAKAGPLVKFTTTLPGDEALGLPRRTVIRDLRIVGHGKDAYQYGLQLDAAMARLERVEVVHCYLGLAVKWAVDVACRDCIFARNYCNVYIPQLGGEEVTTLRFSGCNIRLADIGVLIHRGYGITFDDRTIIEWNTVAGIKVETIGAVADIRCRDVWFEKNGTDVVAPAGVVALENCWQRG